MKNPALCFVFYLYAISSFAQTVDTLQTSWEVLPSAPKGIFHKYYQHQGRLYASGQADPNGNNHIYQSEDDGQSWSLTPGGNTGPYVRRPLWADETTVLSAAPDNDSWNITRLDEGSDSLVLTSDEIPLVQSDLGTQSACIPWASEFFRVNDSTYFLFSGCRWVGGEGPPSNSTLYFSADHGVTWTHNYNGINLPYTFTKVPATDTFLLVGSQQIGYFTRPDLTGGVVKPMPVYPDWANPYAHPFFVVHLHGVTHLFFQYENRHLVSHDFAETWESDTLPYRSIVEVTQVDTFVYLSTSEGLFRSKDQRAEEFVAVYNGQIVPSNVHGFSPLPSGFYLNAASGYTLRSTDTGNTWSIATPGIGEDASALYYNDGEKIWSSNQNLGLFRLDETAETWSVLRGGQLAELQTPSVFQGQANYGSLKFPIALGGYLFLMGW